MLLESATRAVRTGLIASAFLSYLILIGIPGRIGGPALPVLALIAALFFWLTLRRELIGQFRQVSGVGLDSYGGKPGWEIGQQAGANGSRVRELLPTLLGTPLILKGLLSGLTTGLLVAIVSGIFATAMGNGVAIQPVLDKIVPLNVAALIGVSPGQIAQSDVSFIRFLVQVLLFTGAGIIAALAAAAA